MVPRWSSATATHWRRWRFSLPPRTWRTAIGLVRPPEFKKRAYFQGRCGMYTGTLITDLWAEVQRAEKLARRSASETAKTRSPQAAAEFNGEHRAKKALQAEQLPETPGLSPADRNLGLLLIIHAQLVRAFEPGDDFTDAINIHQVGAVRPPKKIRI